MLINEIIRTLCIDIEDLVLLSDIRVLVYINPIEILKIVLECHFYGLPTQVHHFVQL